MLVRNDVCVRMAKTEMQSTRETTLRLRKDSSGDSEGYGGCSLAAGSGVDTTATNNAPSARLDQLVSAARQVNEDVACRDTGKTAQELGDDAGGNGEAVRRGAARDGGKVKDAEDPTVGAASEGNVADGDDGTRARESRYDAGYSNARGDPVIEDPATKDVASKKGADATVDADAEGKERKIAGGDDEPGDGVGGSNDYTAYSGTRADTGATHADTAVGDRDNINPDVDCAPVRQINVPSVQTSQGKGRAKREESKVAPLYSPHEVNRSTSSSCEDEEKRETCDEKDKGEESSDGELSTHLQFLEEKLPRERHSKTKPARETMIVAHVNVDNYVGQVPRKGYASWNSWEAAYEEYCCTPRVKYRVRTSKDVDEYNRKHNANATEAQLHKYFASYHCKHGVYQVRRGSGKRNASVNFTGCPARFDLELMDVASAGEPPRLRLVVHSEWGMHNHASPMAASTPGMKDLPSQGAVVDTIAALHGSNASSSKSLDT
ncbi:hypothetical protein PC115_g12450 [Phytophthora cactorum]|uniref:Uncharacterized protein n=1 Tax=Phytophthora cactorum TaxID=29920 RepID=A0A8T1BW85_9STRA|nr:hypothetical protein PC115_g12450 [Phytophthora cactorum]